MALSGDTLAVGVLDDSCSTSIATVAATDDGCSAAGAVHVLTRAGVTWTFQAYIKAPNAEAEDYFGSSVALSGDTLVVGTTAEDSCSISMTDNGCSGAGAVYVYTRAGVAWSFQAYIKAPNARSNTNFAASVALSGDTLAVGASWEDSCSTSITTVAATDFDTSCSTGATYVFTRAGAMWTLQAYIKASTGNARSGDKFGSSTALSGNTLAVGAKWEGSCSAGISMVAPTSSSSSNCWKTGAVHVFTRSGVTWTFQAYIKAPSPTQRDYFGSSMALSGDTLAVGAPSDEPHFTGRIGGTGATYVFTRAGTTWTLQAYINAPNAGASDNFGQSMALSGDTLAVGAPHESSCSTSIATVAATDDGCSSAGAAYTFTRAGATWTPQAYIKAPNAGASDNFANAMAFSGGTLVVGAYAETSCLPLVGLSLPPSTQDSCNDAGAAYVFAPPCNAGSFPDPSFTAITCTQCPPGSVQPEQLAGYLPCNNCSRGYQQPLAGQTTCEICQAGTYAEDEAQATCTPCPAGRRQPLLGQVLALSCLVCDAGTYASASSAVCTPCPADHFAGIGATECTPCYRGFDCTTGQLVSCNLGAH